MKTSLIRYYNKTTKYIFLIFAVDKHQQKSEIKSLPPCKISFLQHSVSVLLV